MCDIEHFFCHCVKTAAAWNWMKLCLLALGGRGGILVSNIELLKLLLPATAYEQEIVWLISTYVHYVWDALVIEDRENIDVQKMFKELNIMYSDTRQHIKLQLLGLKRIFPP